MTRIRNFAIAILLVAGSLAAAPPPPIRHVFIIVLENKGFNSTFGPSSPATYLSQTLTAQGQLLRQYYGIGHKSLPNYIAMVSGQGPNFETQADCLVYTSVNPGTQTSFFGQTLGQGCVYPAATKTIAVQLAETRLTWKAYVQDIVSPCRRPILNSPDATLNARLGDQYAARHNPFVYFQSLLDSGECFAHDVDLGQLPSDLANTATTPNYAFIVPNLLRGWPRRAMHRRPSGWLAVGRPVSAGMGAAHPRFAGIRGERPPDHHVRRSRQRRRKRLLQRVAGPQHDRPRRLWPRRRPHRRGIDLPIHSARNSQ